VGLLALSAGLAPPFAISLWPSRLLISGISLVHLLALGSLVASALPVWVTVSLGVAVTVSWLISMVRYGNSSSPWFIDRVCHTAEGQWVLRTANGTEHAARLLQYYVHPAVVLLKFDRDRFVWRSVILLPDSAPQEEIRRLRVWLRAAVRER
jgi:hypothetical protein